MHKYHEVQCHRWLQGAGSKKSPDLPESHPKSVNLSPETQNQSSGGCLGNHCSINKIYRWIVALISAMKVLTDSCDWRFGSTEIQWVTSHLPTSILIYRMYKTKCCLLLVILSLCSVHPPPTTSFFDFSHVTWSINAIQTLQPFIFDSFGVFQVSSHSGMDRLPRQQLWRDPGLRHRSKLAPPFTVNL